MSPRIYRSATAARPTLDWHRAPLLEEGVSRAEQARRQRGRAARLLMLAGFLAGLLLGLSIGLTI